MLLEVTDCVVICYRHNQKLAQLSSLSPREVLTSGSGTPPPQQREWRAAGGLGVATAMTSALCTHIRHCMLCFKFVVTVTVR
jgi:hypothetical protein